jgi:hypothetical protein
MKIYIFLGIISVLGVVSATADEPIHGGNAPVAESSPATQLFGSGAIGPAVDMPWGDHWHFGWHQFRNGHLWEDYCLEKRSCHRHNMFDTACPHARCGPVAPTRLSCGRTTRRRCGDHCGQPTAVLDVFFELLGWHDNCCCRGRCDGRCRCATPGQRAADPEPTHAPQEAPLENNHVAPVIDDPRAIPEPVHVDVPSPATADAVESADPEPPLPFDFEPPQLLPDEPRDTDADSDRKPEIPRNKIPEVQPEPPKSSLRTHVRTVVAERLRDYIKTR